MPEVKIYKRTMAIMWVSKILISETHDLTINDLKNHGNYVFHDHAFGIHDARNRECTTHDRKQKCPKLIISKIPKLTHPN